jgi:TatD DNase family protein
MLVDVHCHLDDEKFDKDIGAVISRAKKAGVGAIVCNGTSPASNRKVLKLAGRFDIVKAALGLFPANALKLTDAEVDKELNFIREQKSQIVALGEVGIDFLCVNGEEERARMFEIFAKIVRLANSIRKPLIVHSRKAESEVLDLLKVAKVPVLMHFYCGNAELVKIGVERGYYFTIPTSVLRSKTMRKLAKRVPIDKILTETDAGALRFEGGRNEPSNVRFSVAKIARLKGVSAAEMERQIWENYAKVFR